MVDLHDRLEWVETKPKSVPTQRSTWDRIMSLRKVLILLALDTVLAVAIGYWAGRNEAPQEPEPVKKPGMTTFTIEVDSEAYQSEVERIRKERNNAGLHRSTGSEGQRTGGTDDAPSDTAGDQ